MEHESRRIGKIADFSKHKDWAILDSSGSPLVKAEAEGANRDIYKVFMSPSNRQARKYLRDVVAK
jgi:hypothetical protein